MELIILGLLLLVVVVVAIFLCRHFLAQNSHLSKQLSQANELNGNLLQERASSIEKITALNSVIASQKSNFEQTILQQKESFEASLKSEKAHNMQLVEGQERQRVEEQQRQTKLFNDIFQNIATKIIKEKSDDFAINSRQQVAAIVEPFAKELAAFRQKVDQVEISQAKEQASLKVELSKLFELNHRLGDEASSLVKAIKGESNPKFQGDWGEMILDKILSSSGLVEGEHYFAQESSRNDDNEIIRPDITVRYPDGREIIIDSKVSLVAYVRYVSAEDSDAAQKALNEHIISVKRHIDQLSEKRYDYSSSSLDFVMMFMPVEPAYLLALGGDAALWEYAYKKKIILVSPTHLITALKLVYDLWSRDAQNKNSIEIAKRGATMLDKFAGFVADMESISRGIDTTRKNYDAAMSKLSTGSGNLMRQAEMLKELGVRNSKKLPSEKVK